MKKAVSIWLIAMSAFTVFALSGLAYAQDEAEAVEDDPVILALEREKKIAELKKDIATAKKETQTEELPSTETSGLDGEITLDDDSGYYAELMAYETLTLASKKIKQELGSSATGTIILMGQDNLAVKRQLHKLINNKLAWFVGKYGLLIKKTKAITSWDELGGPESAALLTATPVMLGGVADILAFFKTDLDVKSRAVHMTENALFSAIAGELVGPTRNVIIPELNFNGDGTLLLKLNSISEKRSKLATELQRLEKFVKPQLTGLAEKKAALVKKKTELVDLKKAESADDAKIKTVEGKIAVLEKKIFTSASVKSEWDRLIAEITMLNDGYGQYEKAVTEKSENAPAPIVELAIIDVIDQNKGASRLSVGISSQSAERHITKSIWSSGRISYIGGSVVSYFYFNGEGKLIKAGNIPNWEGASFKARKGPAHMKPDDDEE